MTPFLNTSQLFLTPLAPIHIGCGEDFEPTNYVIAEGILYGFDPSRAVLTGPQRAELANVASRGQLLGIQRFFRTHRDHFIPFAHVAVPVSKGVVKQYEAKVGKAVNTEGDGAQVLNKLAIERHVYTGERQAPFIPGSSFKGALRTAWVDALNAGQPARSEDNIRKGTTALEKRLLQGDFQSSPLRLLKIADFMPLVEPARQVLFAVNRKKRRVLKDGEVVVPKGIAARKDCILHGQYRLFHAGVTLPVLSGWASATDRRGMPLTPRAEQLDQGNHISLFEVARRCNLYHLPRLRQELQVLVERGFLHLQWQRDIERLLTPGGELEIKLQAGRAFLVRIGRYGGAESKTLSGEGVAQIKIMGARGSDATYASATKTVWLAANQEGDQDSMLPFGWAVVEIDPQENCVSLEQWCAAQSAGRPDQKEMRERLAVLKEKAHARAVELAAQAKAQVAAQEAERVREAQYAQAVAQMSPRAQRVEMLRKECDDYAQMLVQHVNFKKKPPNPNVAGIYQNAVRLVKSALEDADWTVAEKEDLAHMLEAWLPKVIAGWDAKEQRKKLRLGQLREGA